MFYAVSDHDGWEEVTDSNLFFAFRGREPQEAEVDKSKKASISVFVSKEIVIEQLGKSKMHPITKRLIPEIKGG